MATDLIQNQRDWLFATDRLRTAQRAPPTRGSLSPLEPAKPAHHDDQAGTRCARHPRRARSGRAKLASWSQPVATRVHAFKGDVRGNSPGCMISARICRPSTVRGPERLKYVAPSTAYTCSDFTALRCCHASGACKVANSLMVRSMLKLQGIRTRISGS